jgi:hypothetical protein
MLALLTQWQRLLNSGLKMFVGNFCDTVLPPPTDD